ncbi:MAG: hypothetical protein ABJB65_04450, partial [Chloroflexota bacterium]
MNSQDRFDELLTERLRADAPREAPDRLLDATMSRIAETPQRGRRRLGRPAVTLLAVAAVLLLAVLAGAQLAGVIERQIGTGPSPSAPVVPSGSTEPSPSAAPTPTPLASPTATPTARPATSSSATFNVLPAQQPTGFVSPITCNEPIGASDPVAIVQLHAAVAYSGDVVLRDYADPSSPRTPCTFGQSQNLVVQLIDARHVVIEAGDGRTYAVVDLPEVSFHWFELAHAPGSYALLGAVSPGLDQVLWLTGESDGTDHVHITTSAGDQVVASLPNPHPGRCGGPEDSKLGAYTHSGAHLFLLNQPIANLNSLLVVEGLTAKLSVLPPSEGWAAGAWPAMAVWSPTTETLFYRQGGDVWQWTPAGGAQRYLPGVSWSYPTITPDGRHLAYAVVRADGLHDVYLVDLAQGGSPQLIGKGARTLPAFLNSTQLWFKSEGNGICGPGGDQPLIYNISDQSESPSIIDRVIGV